MPMLGPHLILDLYGCRKDVIQDPKIIYRILDELPNIIGMRKISEPQVYRVPPNKHTFDKGGVTGFVIIAESHISIHTFIEQAYASIDIFSCKNFNLEKAIKYIADQFKPTNIEKQLIIRGKNFQRKIVTS